MILWELFCILVAFCKLSCLWLAYIQLGEFYVLQRFFCSVTWKPFTSALRSASNVCHATGIMDAEFWFRFSFFFLYLNCVQCSAKLHLKMSIYWKRLGKINVLHLKKKLEVYGGFWCLYEFILQFWICSQEISHLPGLTLV